MRYTISYPFAPVKHMCHMHFYTALHSIIDLSRIWWAFGFGTTINNIIWFCKNTVWWEYDGMSYPLWTNMRNGRNMNFNPTWMNNHTPSKVRNRIMHPFSNFNGNTVEVWEWKKKIHPTLYNGYNYLSMLRLKLIHCSEWGPGCTQGGVVKQILFIHYFFSLGNLQNHCSSIVCQIIILTPITHRDTCHICIVIQGIKHILLWKNKLSSTQYMAKETWWI